MRPILILVAACMFVFMCAGPVNAQETTVGGSIKFFLYDQSDGDWSYVDPDDRVDVEGSGNNGASAGFSNAIISFYREIADDWAVELQPELLAHSGATARLGDMIEREPDSHLEVEILRAAVIWYMPADFEMKAGYLKPLFCWDYGYELFWDEQYNAYFVSANPLLGSWHDVGVEFYKNFETGSASFPTYLYITNGPETELSGQTDDSWTFMLHTQPELMNGNLKFLGSYGTGSYNDDNHTMSRYALGVDFTYAAFNVRGEYMGATYEDMIWGTEDGTPSGWYAKAFYNVTPTWVLMGGYSVLDQNWSPFFYAASPYEESYTQYTIGANWQPADGITVMFAYDGTDGERTAGSVSRSENGEPATIKYSRINVGVRATF